MFPIAVLVRGSHIFGAEAVAGEDVDLYVPYLAGSAQVFKGTQVKPVTVDDRNIDFESNEMGNVIRELAEGNSKTLISLLSPGQLAYTHWFIGLKTIIMQNLSVDFAPSLIEYIDSLVNAGEYGKAARYIHFGLGYYKERDLDWKPVAAPEGGFTAEWCDAEVAALKDAIIEAASLEEPNTNGEMVKMYNHQVLVAKLVAWLISTRSQVFKIEDTILV